MKFSGVGLFATTRGAWRRVDLVRADEGTITSYGAGPFERAR
jgi:hypothetical protein